MNKKVLIFKNDRTGDLFTSIKTINKIINKHKSQKIVIFLSHINYKFNFLFPNFIKKKISMNLNIIEKIKIFFYLFANDIETVYILSPKNFYYYLPFIFRKIKFYAITIKSNKSRPNNFLKKYLYKYVVLDRLNIKKRHSTYNIQQSLIDTKNNQDYINKISNISHNFVYPSEYIFFHYKKNFFKNLLGWDLNQINRLIEFLNKNFNNVLFSSEIYDLATNNFFSSKFNTFDYDSKKKDIKNEKKIFFLKNIDGYDLYDAIDKSSKIISPEGIITHIGYFLKKPILSMLHFNLSNKKDFINQIISCKEWFPPDNYEYTVLKKDFAKSLNKLNKRI